MDQEKPNNKYIIFIKNNKYNLFFAGAIAILFFMIIAMIVLISNHPKTSTSNTTQPNSPTLPYSNTSASSAPLPITTPNPTQAALIENQTQPQIPPATPFTISNIIMFGDNWARMTLTNPTVDTGGLIVEKINGSWKVVVGPGTFFPPQLLQSIGAPQELIDSFNSTSDVSPSPSSSQSNDSDLQ